MGVCFFGSRGRSRRAASLFVLFPGNEANAHRFRSKKSDPEVAEEERKTGFLALHDVFPESESVEYVVPISLGDMIFTKHATF
jgi:hypothetical protein